MKVVSFCSEFGKTIITPPFGWGLTFPLWQPWTTRA
jgi:hypothetical protein